MRLCWEWKGVAVLELPCLHSAEVLLRDAPHGCNSVRSERDGRVTPTPALRQFHSGHLSAGAGELPGGSEETLFLPPTLKKAYCKLLSFDANGQNASLVFCGGRKPMRPQAGLGAAGMQGWCQNSSSCFSCPYAAHRNLLFLWVCSSVQQPGIGVQKATWSWRGKWARFCFGLEDASSV